MQAQRIIHDEGKALLHKQLEAFVQTIPWGRLLLERIRKSQFEPTDARLLNPPKDHYWSLRVKVPPHLQDGFGTAPELLVVVIKGEVQAHDLAAADRQIYGDDEKRLDRDLIVVVSNHPDLSSLLDTFPASRDRCVAWQVEEGRGTETYNLAAELTAVLGSVLARRDLFNERDPVRGRHVIGRRDEVRSLTQQVLAGKSVGLFGLRKVGKTTLIRKVTDELDPQSVQGTSIPALESPSALPRAMVFFVDVQDITAHSLDVVVGLLCREIEARLSQQGFRSSPSRHYDIPRLDKLLDQALEATNLPVCLVIDEYDYLFIPTPIEGLSRLLRLLRAKAQATQRLSIVVTGRDPRLLQSPKLDGVPNPMLAWFQDMWLGPFDKGAADEALRKLGRRVGLIVEPNTLHTALEWTLGHPLLHRQFGSALWHVLRKGNKTPESLRTDPHLQAAVTTFSELEAARVICQEIRTLLSESYPESFSLLRYLSEGRPEDAPDIFEMHGGYTAEACRILRNFGLLAGTAQAPVLPHLLRWYLRKERTR